MRISDWSSDVCSSDLCEERAVAAKFDGANAIVVEASRCRSDCAGDIILGGDVGLAATNRSGEIEAPVAGELEFHRGSDGPTRDLHLKQRAVGPGVRRRGRREGHVAGATAILAIKLECQCGR